MNRTEFIIATAVVLFVAFCLGWFAHWLVHRFLKVPASGDDDLERLALELHHAEETRDQAINYLQQREAELTEKLRSAQSELTSATQDLTESRHEAEKLRSRLDQLADHAPG